MRKWFADLRAETGMTCKALGQKMGHSESYVFRIETGDLKAKGLNTKLLIEIAEATGRDPMDLVRAEIKWMQGKEGEP